MRLQISKTKNAESFYVVKSVYEKGKRTNIIYEKLGTLPEVQAKAGEMEAHEWAKAYVEKLNAEIAEGREEEVAIRLSPRKQIETEERVKYNVGQLYLKKLYHQMRWDKIMKEIKEDSKAEIDLDAVVQMLLYTRILYPSSKRSSLELSNRFIQPTKADLHQVYRALDMLANNMDLIQEGIYKRTASYCRRNTEVLYYDCTNFFFEMEEEDDFRRYGKCKEHRPNPIVQMGMFIDGDGIPMAVTLFPGNENEQGSLKPLEKKILKDFELSQFIVCTDSGLASSANRRFNSTESRHYVVTQSLKTLPQPVMEWALESAGWKKEGAPLQYDYNLQEIDEEKEKDAIFYKEQVVRIGGLDQRLIVTYSVKAKYYQRSVRERQISRAVKTVNTHPENLTHYQQTDYRRLIQMSFLTEEGEVSTQKNLAIDTEAIAREEQFDGFYGICTNLLPKSEKHPEGKTTLDILRINHMRWQIEDCFRDLKSHFKSRPVYLSNENRIKAHFLLCCLSLILFRYLEKAVHDASSEPFSSEQLLSHLRDLEMLHMKGFGYIPAFSSSPLMSALQTAFSLPLDAQITTDKAMKKILKSCSSS